MNSTYHPLQPRSNPRLLSIVIPIFNEQETIAQLRRTMSDFIGRLPCAAEVVVVNDGSSDQSLELLMDWSRTDSCVKVLGFARNFGHQAAVTAGLDIAAGDAVVIMDADLQDPPDVILEMLREYRAGYDVVYGQRNARRGESWMKRLSAWCFYRLMRLFVHPDLPPDTGDFRLISKPVVEAVRAMRETNRFLRGMVAWVGFPQTAVRFDRAARLAGTTKYSFGKMLRFACTAAIGFSAAPLRVSLALGGFVALFGVGAGIWAIAIHWFGQTEKGWTSLMAVICLVGGSILFSIGVLGEYIGRIFEEIKGRPLYVVSTTANVSEAAVLTHGHSAVRATKSQPHLPDKELKIG